MFVLIFVHSLGFDEREWTKMVKYFSEKGFECNALNLRQGLNLRTTHFHDYVDRVKSIVTQDDIVIGHSMGGLVVQKVAEQTIIKGGIGICSAPPHDIKFKLGVKTLLPLLKYIPNMIMKKPFKPDFPIVEKMCRDYMCVGLAQKDIEDIYDHMVEESSIVMQELGLRKIPVDETKITCPLLFIAMTNDRACPPEMIRQLAKKYNARYKEYTGCHHFFYNKNWRDVAKGIHDFIKTL